MTPQLRAYVWWCGDEMCDCYQARIDHSEQKRPGRPPTIWEGTMRDGRWGECNAELNRVAKAMRRHWHDAYRMIEWPWDHRSDR